MYNIRYYLHEKGIDMTSSSTPIAGSSSLVRTSQNERNSSNSGNSHIFQRIFNNAVGILINLFQSIMPNVVSQLTRNSVLSLSENQFQSIRPSIVPTSTSDPVLTRASALSPSGKQFFSDCSLVVHTLSFLSIQDLRVLSCGLPFSSPIFNDHWKHLCLEKGLISATALDKVDYKRMLLEPLGPRLIQEYYGKIDITPIPQEFIKRASLPDPLGKPGELYKDAYRLAYIPEHITITVGENSLLMLDETTAVGEKKARLVEDPERAPREARSIRVPVTLNNLILLTQRYLKEKDRSLFNGIIQGYTLEAVLNQNEDKGVGPSHWSYQRTKVIGSGSPYHSQDGRKGQEELAREAGLEIVPLTDRILFGLLLYLESGTYPHSNCFERTSAVTRTYDGNLRQLSIGWAPSRPYFFWRAAGPDFCLDLGSDRDHCAVGAAAGVPAGTL
jgi:hypothetical protein